MAEFSPARSIEGKVAGLFQALGDSFVSSATDVLTLTYEGIPGDVHAGLYRKSGAREPWYPRGTPMRNERQISILSAEELTEVAGAMELEELRPEWIGGNVLLAGVAELSLLPARTILMFPSGAAIRIDGDNGPCRSSGRAIAEHSGHPEAEFGFVKAAKHKRGLVGWVEREGEIKAGDIVTIRVWEHSLYTA